jgi:transcriptional regulator with XRE-family HTH domain
MRRGQSRPRIRSTIKRRRPPRWTAEIGLAFGSSIRERRISRKLSQRELGDLTGIDRTFVSAIERGLRQPTLTTLLRIAKALGVSPPGELLDCVDPIVAKGRATTVKARERKD